MMPGREFRSLRAYYHLSQTRLAQLLGVNRNTIAAWESASAPAWARYLDWPQIHSDSLERTVK